jgi:uncharacterized protein (TIGR02145 family)
MKKSIPFPLQLLGAMFVVFIFTFSRCEDDDDSGIGQVGCKFGVFDGNNQSGKLEGVLSKPIRVRLRDERDAPRVGVRVRFTVESGGGQVSESVTLTGADGVAQITWRLGNNCGQQRIKARITEGQCDGRELTIIASADTATIAGTDYPVVVIGGNCWMAQNLRWNILLLGVNHRFHPAATSAEQQLYGRLYTLPTNNGPQLCPGHWRIPTNQDWDNLIRSYNANWPNSTNTPAQLLYPNGQSGFNAHVWGGGGGENSINAGRPNFIQGGYYWSATVEDNLVWRYRFQNNNIQRQRVARNNQYSCRCVKQ